MIPVELKQKPLRAGLFTPPLECLPPDEGWQAGTRARLARRGLHSVPGEVLKEPIANLTRSPHIPTGPMKPELGQFHAAREIAWMAFVLRGQVIALWVSVGL